MLRRATMERLLMNREADTEQFVNLTQQESTQKVIAMYMKKLAQKSKS